MGAPSSNVRIGVGMHMGKGEERWERGWVVLGAGERLAKMASYGDLEAQGPSNRRESYLLAAHCRCLLLLLRALFLWRPRHKLVCDWQGRRCRDLAYV